MFKKNKDGIDIPKGKTNININNNRINQNMPNNLGQQNLTQQNMPNNNQNSVFYDQVNSYFKNKVDSMNSNAKDNANNNNGQNSFNNETNISNLNNENKSKFTTDDPFNTGNNINTSAYNGSSSSVHYPEFNPNYNRPRHLNNMDTSQSSSYNNTQNNPNVSKPNLNGLNTTNHTQSFNTVGTYSNAPWSQNNYNNVSPQYNTYNQEQLKQQAAEKNKQNKKKSLKSLVVFTCMIAFIIGVSFTLREFVFQSYEIPSGSMETTILPGDMVFAEKLSHYFTSPKVGDIITFNDPNVEGRILIKRCVATEGQVVNINNNKLYVDGKEMIEPYVNNRPTKTLNGSHISFPYTVPEGHVWVMGDNRTNSQDSRYFGSIPVSSVIGHAVFTYFPISSLKFL